MFYFSTYCPNLFKHLTYPIYKQVSEYFLQKMMVAATVQATDEQLIAPPYLMRISAHPAFFHWLKKMVQCTLLICTSSGPDVNLL